MGKKFTILYAIQMSIRWKSIAGMHFTDEELDTLRKYLTEGTTPPDLSTDQLRRYREKYQHFAVRDNEVVLLVNEQPPWVKDSGLQVDLPFTLRVLGQTQREQVLAAVWKESGHRSSKYLYDRLRREFVGIPEKQVIQEWLKKQTLHQMQVRPLEQKVVQPILTQHAFQQWEMDLIDVSEWSGENDGVTFLMCVIDIFTKYAWIRAIPNKSAPIVAAALQGILLDFSIAPEVISSDRGPEFTSNEMKALSMKFGFELRPSLPYHPAANGAVERFNGTIKKAILSHMGETNTYRYVEHLPFIVRAYNTTKHSTTKVQPAEAMYQIHIKDTTLRHFITKNIKTNGEKMVAKSLRKVSAMQEELEPGDTVRIDTAALKGNRKHALLTHKRGVLRWSSELYLISGMQEDEKSKGVWKYTVESEDGEPLEDDAGKDLFLFRHQLQKVNPNTLQPQNWASRDEEYLPPAEPLRELHDEKVNRLLPVPQEVLNKKVEAEQQAEVEKLAREGPQLRSRLKIKKPARYR